jgi:hypothetical protein
VDRNIMNPEFKFELVHKQWKALYDFDEAMRLKKRSLYKKNLEKWHFLPPTI